MSRRLADAKPTQRSVVTIQRKCACGSSKRGSLGQCTACEDQHRLQTKLQIGSVADPLEAEADQVADRLAAGWGIEGLSVSAATGRLQRDGTQELGDNEGIENQLASRAGTGQPLDRRSRKRAERHLGRRFDSVRVHSDGEADRMNRDLGARAFTHGNDIYFAAGSYRPESRSGFHLIAHELTHVVQQQGGSGGLLQRQAAGGAGGGAGGGAAPAAGGGLTPEMLEQIARRLREAMQGLGTDEEAIYGALSGRSQDQVNAIETTYERLYDRDLQADIRDELTDSEMETLAMQSPEGRSEAERMELIANQLHQAMDQLGTDETQIYSALTGRTSAERTAIKTAYKTLTGRALLNDLRDELSGDELTEAVRLLNQGVLQPEDELFLAMSGAGTDEGRIERIMDELRGDPAAITAMESAYRAKYGDIIADLRGDLSGSDLDSAIGSVAPTLPNAAFEDCNPGQISDLRSAMPLVDQKIARAMQILGQGWASMSQPEKTAFSAYFDPSGSGVDQRFVSDVLGNFRSLRADFDAGLTFECEDATGGCGVAGRYGYTYFGNIHICPHFYTMSAMKQSRGILHEMTHNALWAVDRHYGWEGEFAQLTPRGNWGNQIPVFGPLIRLIARDDTLYNPDSYAYFAFNV